MSDRRPTAATARKSRAATVTRTREQLRYAIDRACIARGEAQWTAGYRAAAEGFRQVHGDEADRLYRKMIAQFRECERAEKAAERATAAYARALRASK